MKRERVVSVRMDDDEFDALQFLAGREPLSAYCRRVLLDGESFEDPTKVPAVPVVVKSDRPAAAAQNGNGRKFSEGEMVMLRGVVVKVFGFHAGGGYVVEHEGGRTEVVSEGMLSKVEQPEE